MSRQPESIPAPHAEMPPLLLGLLLLLLWMITHSYSGLIHDAVLYSMQGLAHLHPDLYGNDIFLRYGSQDQYSVFAPLYAHAIGSLGLEHAAALVTLVSQGAFFLCAWILARQLSDRRGAAAAVCLLLLFNGVYGAKGVFHVAEDFLTPRLGSEALVLAGIALALKNRPGPAALLCLAAALLHPLMAMPGFVFLFWMHVVAPKPRLGIGLGILGLLTLIVVGLAAAGTRFQFDPQWFGMITSRLSYLVLQAWSLSDWATALMPLTTLTVGAVVCTTPKARMFMLGTLLAGLCGLTLAAVGGDWLRLTIFIQGQPWRWMWFATVASTLALPLIGLRLWQMQLPGRLALALLVSSYLLHGEPAAIATMIASALCAVLSARRAWTTPPRAQRLLYFGLTGLVALCAMINVANVLLTMRVVEKLASSPEFFSVPRMLARSEVSALVLAAALWFAIGWRAKSSFWQIALLAVTGCAGLVLPRVAPAWTQLQYRADLFKAFAPWRASIPRGTEVLYLQEPLSIWVLLQRPSYLTGMQAASLVFSHQAAVAIQERTTELAGYGAEEGVSFWEGKDGLEKPDVTAAQVCSKTQARYLVTHNDLHAPFLGLPPSIRTPFKGLRLYSCANAEGGP
jgi:hypothetical protein